MDSSLSIPIAHTRERRALFEAAILEKPSSDEDLLDPGHIDFVMYLSEVWKPSRLKESKAMPISKTVAVAALILGFWLLARGLSLVANASVPQISAPLSADLIGFGLVVVGCALLMIITRLFVRFIVELLELIH